MWPGVGQAAPASRPASRRPLRPARSRSVNTNSQAQCAAFARRCACLPCRRAALRGNDGGKACFARVPHCRPRPASRATLAAGRMAAWATPPRSPTVSTTCCRRRSAAAARIPAAARTPRRSPPARRRSTAAHRAATATIAALAALLDVPAPSPDPAFGVAAPLTLARIDEAACIGCTLCIRACPVDAIVGAARRMHTVLADRCTGCELCLPPCPVDCIVMTTAGRAWTAADAAAARARFQSRKLRLAQGAAARTPRPDAKATPRVQNATPDARRQAVAAALARARARRARESR